MNLGKAILVAMTEKRITCQSVKEQTGWSIVYISEVRRCRKRATPMARLTKWAEVLGVTPIELLQRAEQYPDPETQPQPKSGSEVAA